MECNPFGVVHLGYNPFGVVQLAGNPFGVVSMTAIPPDAILTESFRIIAAEVGPHSFGPLEWPIVRRIIHSSGDLGMAELVQFSENAAVAGVRALQSSAPIITDVRMVAAGIQAPLREALGAELHCFLDHPELSITTDARALTRCARGMELAIAKFPEAVYVVGNAPTALSTLAAAVRNGIARPRLIIAMPVGFVGVIESKNEAMALPVPVIAIRGRRGGSAVAAAAVNALLILAKEEGPA